MTELLFIRIQEDNTPPEVNISVINTTTSTITTQTTIKDEGSGLNKEDIKALEEKNIVVGFKDFLQESYRVVIYEHYPILP